ncbi:MAG TPA: hypothetical protein VJ551_02945 [Nitrososphaeraceae archaeon]|nr:hypothetical protein [Nitrososphaeraceae archaeon]
MVTAICDTDGKIMYSDHRPGVTNLLTPDESRKSLEMAVSAWKSKPAQPEDRKGQVCACRVRKDKTHYNAFGGQASCIPDHTTTGKPCGYFRDY